MANTPSVAITALDYADLLAQVTALQPAVTPGWNISDLSDPVRFLLEVYLRSIERANWFSNAVAQEYSLQTSVDARFILAHARRLGYAPATRQPATLEMLLTVNPSATQRTISAYSMTVSTAASSTTGAVVFENLDPIQIYPNGTYAQATFVQGSTTTDTFTAQGVPFEFYVLSQQPVIREQILPSSLTVTVGSTSWNPVVSLADSKPTDTDVLVSVDQDGVGSIRFGNGVLGAIPASGSPIVVSYRVGGGVIGNVASNTVSQIVTAPTYVTVVTNPAAGAGGADDQSLSDIKVLAPMYAATAGQLNTLSAIETAVNSTTAVARSRVTRIGNRVLVQIIQQQGYLASVVTDAVQTLLRPQVIMGFEVDVIPPNYLEVEVQVTVWGTGQNTSSDVTSAVQTQISRWLDPLGKDANGNYINDFGREVRLSTLGLLLGELVAQGMIYDYQVTSPTSNVQVAADTIVTNTHLVTASPVITLAGNFGSVGVTQ